MKRLTTPELIEVMKRPVGDYCKLCGAAQIHDKHCPNRAYINPAAIHYHKES